MTVIAELAIEELRAAWTAAGLYRLPLILRVAVDRSDRSDRNGQTAVVELGQEQCAARRTAEIARLRATGVLADLADALDLIARPRWAVNAWLVAGYADPEQAERESMRAYGAAGDDVAAMVMLCGGRVTIATTTPYQLVNDLVALTGDVPAGDSRPINVPADLLHAGLDRGERSQQQTIDQFTERGVQRDQAGVLATLATTAVRHGQFDIETLDAGGVARPVPGTIGFCDTPRGRWAVLGDPAGTAANPGWLTVTPADRHRLAAMVARLAPSTT